MKDVVTNLVCLIVLLWIAKLVLDYATLPESPQAPMPCVLCGVKATYYVVEAESSTRAGDRYKAYRPLRVPYCAIHAPEDARPIPRSLCT